MTARSLHSPTSCGTLSAAVPVTGYDAVNMLPAIPCGADRTAPPTARRRLAERKENPVRRVVLLLCLLPLLAYALPAAPASAADKKRLCFAQVPDCIEFRFRSFWSGNGGLPVFGLPLTTDRNEQVGDQKYKVQYFERFRFEQHKENPAPYDVLLGRIGVDQLTAQGRDWQTFAKADLSAPHYFAETGHAIAAQFWGFWSRNGLEFDGNKKAKSVAESLALFGFPVSEPRWSKALTARCT